jgi:phosphonate transport system permease protein
MTAVDINAAKTGADQLFQRKKLIGFGVPAVVFAYLVYIFFAFDVPVLAGRANWDNAVTLASDSWSHKVHVTRNNRSGEVSYAVEGERKGSYPEGQRPDWVSGDEVITIDLGGDHID